VSGSEQPSRAELLALIEAQARTIEQLQAEIVELKRRLGRNSGNSSQPPSTDGPAVSPSRAERRRSARRVGAENRDTASHQHVRGQPTDLAVTVTRPTQHDRSLWPSDSVT
jgi:hypothetical protein